MPSTASRVRLLVLAAALPALVALAGCGDVAIEPEPEAVVGAGEIVSDDRSAGPIERISVGADIQVVIRTGTPGSVTLAAQENLLPLVRTEVRDGQLIVNVPSPGYVTQEPVTLTVVAPLITAITLSGGADGALEFVGDALGVDLSGAASVTGIGRAEALTVTASSEARIDFTDLVAATADVRLSGGAGAILAVDEALTGDASGGATVTLTTPTPSVDVTTSSGGSVQGGPSPSP